jgi:hypothetical protein
VRSPAAIKGTILGQCDDVKLAHYYEVEHWN